MMSWHPCFAQLQGAGRGPMIRGRASSYDRTGGNHDYLSVAPGAGATLLDHSGDAGHVARLWMTLKTDDPAYLTGVKMRFTFDGVTTVHDIPLGMFTAVGPWAVHDVCSSAVSVMRARLMNQDQAGAGLGSFNLHWPMPFERTCRMEVVNGCAADLKLFFHVDYFLHGRSRPPRPLFQATHRLHEPTSKRAERGLSHDPDVAPGSARHTGPERKNLSRAENHLFADITGHYGFYAGTFLAVESHPDRPGKWYEGDDMFFVDHDAWPPTLHGTGTEDYFGLAWGVHRPFQAFDHGVTHYERRITDHDRYYDGRFGLYRWHVADPIPFHRSLHASIEMGHANECQQRYESVAFWYGINR